MAARVYQQSESQTSPPAPDVQPSGTRVVQDVDGVRLIATCRHPIAFYYLPFMAFVTTIVGSILIGPYFRGQTPNGVALLIGLFFLLFALPFWWVALCYVAGRTEVLVTRDELRAFTGIGILGRTLRLPRSHISRIETPPRMRTRNMYNSGGFRATLQPPLPDDPRTIYFGRLLTEARRDWLAREMLRHMDRNAGDV